MASITIRNLDDDVKTRLRVRAADNGRSMEEEARLILRDVVGRKPSPGASRRPSTEPAAMTVLLDTRPGRLRRQPACHHVRHSKPTMKARPGMLLPTPPFEKAVLASRGSRLIAMKSGWSFLFNRLRTAPVSHSPLPSS